MVVVVMMVLAMVMMLVLAMVMVLVVLAMFTPDRSQQSFVHEHSSVDCGRSTNGLEIHIYTSSNTNTNTITRQKPA